MNHIRPMILKKYIPLFFLCFPPSPLDGHRHISLPLSPALQWAAPLADDAPAPDAPAQGHDDDSARPLSLPPLNLLASLRVQQDEDNGAVAARPSLPPQRQVTKHIIQSWTL